MKQYLPFVSRIAHMIVRKLPASVEVDDLIQAGMIGLWEAMQRFDDASEATLETFAGHRIRGAIFDELRAADWMSRRDRRSQHKIAKALLKLEHELGRRPTEAEMAEEMNLPLPSYQERSDRARLHGVPDEDAPEALEIPDDGDGPFEHLAHKQREQALTYELRALPKTELLVMGMLFSGLRSVEAGQELSVCASRVDQIKRSAISKLRKKLADH